MEWVICVLCGLGDICDRSDLCDPWALHNRKDFGGRRDLMIYAM